MLDRHAVQALLEAGTSPKQVARQFQCSRRTIERIAREPAVIDADDARARAARRLGRPGVDPAISGRIAEWLTTEPDLPPGEVHRRLREAGTPLGLSTVYRLLTAVRATLPAPIMVRFEGVAGEFAQFDFGHTEVRLVDGARRRVHFAAYRLKWSRWLWVVVVPNERVEALIRALLASFAASGGVPLKVVFDNPKTVVLRRDEGRPVWNSTLAQCIVDYGTSIELCTPHAPEQKGSVENLVGFAKRAFFRARRFQDLTTDLPQQLAEWLVEVNEARASRATGVIPAIRLAEEQQRLQPLAVAPADYGLQLPVHVGPTAMVAYQGRRAACPPRSISIRIASRSCAPVGGMRPRIRASRSSARSAISPASAPRNSPRSTARASGCTTCASDSSSSAPSARRTLRSSSTSAPTRGRAASSASSGCSRRWARTAVASSCSAP
ncbi:MAG: IS21 family transposase [Gemmatimonadaceae bacterium]|nr:IS21 family transposase [Gemmatimonadaceae bacterium]